MSTPCVFNQGLSDCDEMMLSNIAKHPRAIVFLNC